MATAIQPTSPTILTVTDLTQRIKGLLEETFDFVWVVGEIANLRIPASGHHYFTLKDENAQISAVMFRGAARSLAFRLKDGQRITGMGRVSVYPPRGNYQLILEYLTPDGVGALQLAFEQLKERLAAEGLFDTERKRPLPSLPRHVTLVTSPSGSVVHDFINIASRRFPTLPLSIVPVRVQGSGAEKEIAAAIAFINRSVDTDVIVVCRGGGSLEDLQAFNSEGVARAIAASRIPVVSAVGHETDVTIADFTADVRAPTPSAAAEMIVPAYDDLNDALARMRRTMRRQWTQRLARHRSTLIALQRRLGSPRRRIADLCLRVDDLSLRMSRLVSAGVRRRREKLQWQSQRLSVMKLRGRVLSYKQSLDLYYHNILKSLVNFIDHRRSTLSRYADMLTALDPSAVLQRGYSITRSLEDGCIVRNAAILNPGHRVAVTLATGKFEGRVTTVIENDPSTTETE